MRHVFLTLLCAFAINAAAEASTMVCSSAGTFRQTSASITLHINRPGLHDELSLHKFENNNFTSVTYKVTVESAPNGGKMIYYTRLNGSEGRIAVKLIRDDGSFVTAALGSHGVWAQSPMLCELPRVSKR